MKKLPKVFKRKWLKALRSGEYEQGIGDLYSEGCYCCLGVAGAVCGYKDEELKGHIMLDSYHQRVPEVIRTGSAANVLSSMNDHMSIASYSEIMPNKMYKTQRSFKQIANWIEKNL